MKHTVPLKKNHEFRRLYQKGASAVGGSMVIYCRKNRLGRNRVGITVSVKLGNAVKRNRARRRIRELYRTSEAQLRTGFDLVIVARTRVIYGRYAELERSLRQLFKKLGLLEPSGGEDKPV